MFRKLGHAFSAGMNDAGIIREVMTYADNGNVYKGLQIGMNLVYGRFNFLGTADKNYSVKIILIN